MISISGDHHGDGMSSEDSSDSKDMQKQLSANPPSFYDNVNQNAQASCLEIVLQCYTFYWDNPHNTKCISICLHMGIFLVNSHGIWLGIWVSGIESRHLWQPLTPGCHKIHKNMIPSQDLKHLSWLILRNAQIKKHFWLYCYDISRLTG